MVQQYLYVIYRFDGQSVELLHLEGMHWRQFSEKTRIIFGQVLLFLVYLKKSKLFTGRDIWLARSPRGDFLCKMSFYSFLNICVKFTGYFTPMPLGIYGPSHCKLVWVQLAASEYQVILGKTNFKKWLKQRRGVGQDQQVSDDFLLATPRL